MQATTELQLPSSHSYDFESDPVAAMTEYSRVMHSHTMKQMENARRASRRRDAEKGTISTETQLRKEDSISSQSSRGSV
jgi:hypothetical protein